MATAADLVVEDGTGLDDANSYVDLVTGESYHSLRSNTGWTQATENQKATALIHATQYLDHRWCFVGTPSNPSDPNTAGQALQWPRENGNSGNLIDSRGNEIGTDEIPFWIIDASLEYALAYLVNGRLMPDPAVPDDAGRFVSLKRERIGPLEEETRFSDTRATRTTRTYALADRILKESGLVVNIGGGGRAIRA